MIIALLVLILLTLLLGSDFVIMSVLFLGAAALFLAALGIFIGGMWMFIELLMK